MENVRISKSLYSYCIDTEETKTSKVEVGDVSMVEISPSYLSIINWSTGEYLYIHNGEVIGKRKGIIKEDCIWFRDGVIMDKNHICLAG